MFFTSWSLPVLATGCVTRTSSLVEHWLLFNLDRQHVDRPKTAYNDSTKIEMKGLDAVELEAFVGVKLGRPSGAWVAAWGYVS